MVQVPEQYLHVDMLLFDVEFATTIRVSVDCRLLLARLVDRLHVLVFDHLRYYFLNDWVYSEGSSFEHRDVVVVIDQVSLRRSLAD